MGRRYRRHDKYIYAIYDEEDNLLAVFDTLSEVAGYVGILRRSVIEYLCRKKGVAVVRHRYYIYRIDCDTITDDAFKKEDIIFRDMFFKRFKKQ